jgi:hypothetical protein
MGLSLVARPATGQSTKPIWAGQAGQANLTSRQPTLAGQAPFAPFFARSFLFVAPINFQYFHKARKLIGDAHTYMRYKFGLDHFNMVVRKFYILSFKT